MCLDIEMASVCLVFDDVPPFPFLSSSRLSSFPPLPLSHFPPFSLTETNSDDDLTHDLRRYLLRVHSQYSTPAFHICISWIISTTSISSSNSILSITSRWITTRLWHQPSIPFILIQKHQMLPMACLSSPSCLITKSCRPHLRLVRSIHSPVSLLQSNNMLINAYTHFLSICRSNVYNRPAAGASLSWSKPHARCSSPVP